jgi:hypothetical protein
MGSQDHRQKRSERGGPYLLCRPMRRGDEGPQEGLPCPGRYQTVADHLRGKEVVGGAGARRRRYVVGHQPAEATRQRAHRRQVFDAREAELASLHEVRGARPSKRGGRCGPAVVTGGIDA